MFTCHFSRKFYNKMALAPAGMAALESLRVACGSDANLDTFLCLSFP